MAMNQSRQTTARLDASVIVCTYSRSPSLKRTELSLQAQIEGLFWRNRELPD